MQPSWQHGPRPMRQRRVSPVRSLVLMLMLAVSISIFTLETSWAQTTTTEATTTSTTSSPSPQTCSEPGPSTVSESALCEIAEQVDSWRAEGLLASVLVVTCLAVLVALRLWK